MSSSKSLFEDVKEALSDRKLGSLRTPLKKRAKLHKYTFFRALFFACFWSHNEIYVVTAHNAPNVMREIGRLREIAFREAGGGTGKSILIAVDEILDEKRVRHIDSFIKEHPEALKITSGANNVIYKEKE